MQHPQAAVTPWKQYILRKRFYRTSQSGVVNRNITFKPPKHRLSVDLRPTVEKRRTTRSSLLRRDPASTGQIAVETRIYEAYQPIRRVNIDSAALSPPLERAVNASTDPHERLRPSNEQLRLVTLRQERQRSEEQPVWVYWGRRLQVGNNTDNRDQTVTDDTDLLRLN